jgi:DNA-directed RNA polymerase specialized sigma24 family protein
MERIVDLVYRISFRILCDRFDSEEVTRKVLSDAGRWSVVYEGEFKSKDWFIRHTCILCRMAMIRRKTLWLINVRKEVFVRASPRVEDQDDYTTKQAWQVYCRAVHGMTPLQVMAYVLCVLEGISEARVMKILNITQARLSHLLKKATASIRGELAVYGRAELYRDFVSFIRRVDEVNKPQAKDLLTEYSDSVP